jgi:GTP-binding protein
MKVKDAVFIKSARIPGEYPQQGLPEIAFAGRSNVGKSSLINRLVHRRDLAKTSSTPGKTRLLNFFAINATLSLVDLPGYGFARVSEGVRKSWGAMVETYLKKRKELRLVVLLVDARLGPTDLDLQLIGWLRHYHIRFITVATKIDKISKSRRASAIKRIRDGLTESSASVLPFSAVTGEGKDLVWKEIMEACQGPVRDDAKDNAANRNTPSGNRYPGDSEGRRNG